MYRCVWFHMAFIYIAQAEMYWCSGYHYVTLHVLIIHGWLVLDMSTGQLTLTFSKAFHCNIIGKSTDIISQSAHGLASEHNANVLNEIKDLATNNDTTKDHSLLPHLYWFENGQFNYRYHWPQMVEYFIDSDLSFSEKFVDVYTTKIQRTDFCLALNQLATLQNGQN